MSMFTSPSQAAGFTPADHLGHLLIIQVTEYVPTVQTSLGEKDAISATIHDVDTGDTFEDALIFPKVLVSSLRNRVGQTVLATLTQGQAKPGQSAPWTLTDATGDPAAVAKATRFMEAYQSGQYAAPEQSAAASGESPEVAAARALLAQKGLA